MNSKGITPLTDPDVCLICQKRKSDKKYSIYGRGYGSDFDLCDIGFNVCNECDKPEFESWFDENPTVSNYNETYEHEEELTKLFKSLSLNSREQIYNGDDGHFMNPQDWIDYELDELPYEKCKEYGLYSPQEILAYKERFPTCGEVFKRTFRDGSAWTQCLHGAIGNKDGTPSVNISTKCYMCSSYKPRIVAMIEKHELVMLIEHEKTRLGEMFEYSSTMLEKLNADPVKYFEDNDTK